MRDFDGMDIDFSDVEINNAIRVPVVLLIDVSGSMKPLMQEVNRAIREFISSLKNDAVAAKSVELSIISFDHEVKLIQDFDAIDKINVADTELVNNGGATFTGTALMNGLALVNDRKTYYQENGYDYYQPWLVIMTDGMPSAIDSDWLRQSDVSSSHPMVATELEALEDSRNILHSQINDKKLNLINIAIGDDADLGYLKSLHPANRAFKMTADTDFSKFFEWLGKSVKAKSNSQKGDAVKTAPLSDAGLDLF